jgi:hypothetical protein
MRLLMLWISSSGVTDLIGYSVAGAFNSVLVTGCGESIVGSSFNSGIGSICWEGFRRGPVRTVEGRICSKPWEEATFSMDLKYCKVGH